MDYFLGTILGTSDMKLNKNDLRFMDSQKEGDK